MVFVLMEGEISASELKRHLTAVYTEQRDGSCDRLIVIRNSKCLLSGSDVARMAKFARKLHGFKARHRTAIVASSACEFGISWQYQLYSDASLDRFNIFRELNEATAWLGLDSVAVGSPIERCVVRTTEPLYDDSLAAG